MASYSSSALRCLSPASEGWRTFLRNHAPDIAAMDLFVVPTIGFDLLYAIVIVRLVRRDLVWINVTAFFFGSGHPFIVTVALLESLPWPGEKLAARIRGSA